MTLTLAWELSFVVVFGAPRTHVHSSNWSIVVVAVAGLILLPPPPPRIKRPLPWVNSIKGLKPNATSPLLALEITINPSWLSMQDQNFASVADSVAQLAT